MTRAKNQLEFLSYPVALSWTLGSCFFTGVLLSSSVLQLFSKGNNRFPSTVLIISLQSPQCTRIFLECTCSAHLITYVSDVTCVAFHLYLNTHFTSVSSSIDGQYMLW